MVGEWKLYNFGVSGNYLQISETVHFREVYRLKKKDISYVHDLKGIFKRCFCDFKDI